MSKLLKSGTIALGDDIAISGFAAVGSKKEGEGPIGNLLDLVVDDSYFGESSWEKAESKLQRSALEIALEKASLTGANLDTLFAGDLLNQCVGSAYGLRDFDIPYVGIYGACSTMAEGLILASLFISADFAKHTAAVTSSHFCSAERQFRFPLAYGCQRTPTAQWTATAAGAAILSKNRSAPIKITSVTIGKVIDYGIDDLSNMGAAMMPAAHDTIKRHLEATGTTPSDYDAIVTGDLAAVGSELLVDSMLKDGIDISKKHMDCGLILYDRNSQNVDSGASGCGCSASVLCSKLLSELSSGKLKNILFVATGALMSTLTIQQGETIPAVAHLVQITSNTQGGNLQ